MLFSISQFTQHLKICLLSLPLIVALGARTASQSARVIRAGSPQPTTIPGDDLMAALASAPLMTVYHEDGAADATVTAVVSADPRRQDAPAAVRAILDAGPSCIPLLIAHLDDQRLAAARFDGGRFADAPIKVPLGHLCLDILIHATSGRRVHVVNCTDDGLGACVRSGYYFRPDALQGRGGVAKMRQVQTRWQRAHQAKRIRFEYPAWLKRG